MYYNREQVLERHRKAQRKHRNQMIGGWTAGIVTVGLVGLGIAQIDFPEYVHPCEGLAVSEQAVSMAQQGFEVEVMGRNGAECELTPQGTWILDD